MISEPPVNRANKKHTAERPSRADRDGIVFGLVLTLLFHLLFFYATPRRVTFTEPVEHRESPSLRVELVPIPEEPELEQQYVRAAPDVPDEKPEQTINISDRDQRAAQPEDDVPPDMENMPYVEGDEEESNRLVQGDPFQQPSPPSPPTTGEDGAESPMPEQMAAPNQRPVVVAPDFMERPEELPDEGLATTQNPDLAEKEPDEDPEEATELTMDVLSPQDGRGQAEYTTPPQQNQAQTAQPRPRPQVERDTSFGPIKDNRRGALRIGNLAFDAQYSEFGEYWRRVAEIIERRWRSLVYNSRSVSFSGTRVVISFDIARDGRVINAKVENSTSGRLPETISMDAIMGESPFFPWTPEMIVTMGESTRCTIHFLY